MLKKVSNFIVSQRYWILGILLLAAAASVFLMQKVEINEDMTKYLPDDSTMKAGMDIMEQEFPEMEMFQTIRVMFDDLTNEEKTVMQDRLENLEYVDSVTYEADSEDYNKENHTLFVVNTEYDYGSPEELAIERALDENFGEYTMDWHNDDTSSTDIPAWIIAAALAILLAVLFAMCDSWIEPILFIAVIGVAIVINMGTNILLGSVSDVTFSIAAILQLVLSMDYSIILINRYRQEKEHAAGNKQAMQAALAHAFSSIASSSLTTVVGLLMLVFMSFKIGMDLGIVLAKGVFISMVCVLTMMPGVILACDKLIQKTAKKELHIPMDWAAGFSYKLRHGLAVGFVLLFAGVYWLQSQAGIAYTLPVADSVAEIFPASNTLVMVYETGDEEAVSQLAAELEEDENVQSVMAYSTMLAKPYTAAGLAEEIADMGGDFSLDADIIHMLYYDYFQAGRTGLLTASEFLDFISGPVMENETFAEYIDQDMRDNIDLIQKFSDPSALTAPMDAEELAGFFEMDPGDIRDLMLYYYIENGGVPTGSMPLPTFADFVVNEVAKDETYGELFDGDTLAQMERLLDFTDADKMTAAYNYKGIATLLGMDAETVKLLFVYYYALSDSYAPAAMTLPTFVDFVRNDIASNPTFGSAFDAAALAQMNTLASLTNANTISKQMAPAELASLLGMDKSMVEQIYTMYYGSQSADKGIPFAAFTSFLVNTVMKNPSYASQFDEATQAGLQQMDQMASAAASGQALTPAQLAKLTGMDEGMVQALFTYKAGKDAKTPVTAMPLQTFIDFLVEDIAVNPAFAAFLDAATLQQLAGLQQMLQAAAAGTPLDASTLAAMTGMDEGMVQALFTYKAGLDSPSPVTAMTVTEFLDYLQNDVAANPIFSGYLDSATLAQLAGLRQMVDLAVSGVALDAQTLASLTGMESGMVQTLFVFRAAQSAPAVESMKLPDFLAFLVDEVAADPLLGAQFDKAVLEQMKALRQMVELSATGAALTYQQAAQALGMEEAQLRQLYALYWGQDISGKTLSVQQAVGFLLTDGAMSSSLDAAARQQLGFLQTIMSAAQSGKNYSYSEMGSLLGMDSSMAKMLYTYHDAGSAADSWTLSMYGIINFLMDNNSAMGSMMGSGESAQLAMAQKLINGTVNGVSYSADSLAELLGMDVEQAEQLYLLYISRHGDTSDWTLSVKGFIDFINSDILPDPEFAGQFDTETADMLHTAQTLMDAVISGKSYTAAQMSGLFDGLSEDLDENTMELMYLYAASEKNSDPAWTLTMETLFQYLVDQVMDDPRFADVIDEEMKAELLDAQTELTEGKEQLVSEKYSRLIISSSYPEESAETTAFLAGLVEKCGENLSGPTFFIGNSAMTYEMQQIFDHELLFITMLTAAAIFLIVALTFKSVFIPLILVLVVQCGVYATISVVGLQGGSMYYLALLIVECILMGATIDYGILFTNYYCESRGARPIRDALKAAYAGSTHTILTSGLILILVTAIVGNFFEEPTVSAIVKTISIGALCATVLILFILPGLLAVCDRFVVRKKYAYRHRKE